MKSLKDKSKINELFLPSVGILNSDIFHIRYCKGDNKSLICVPKKKFKRAVDRNRIKRIIKSCLIDKESLQLNIAFVYINKTILDYKSISKDVDNIFTKLK